MHLLLVEDDPALAGLLHRLLSSDRHVVEVAPSGEEALDVLATQGGLEAIVLDVKLPGISGLEVARRVRRRGSHVPILMLTTESSDEMKAMGRAAGANGWLVKPFDPKKLIAVVKKVIG